jgi:hypothetical protein
MSPPSKPQRTRSRGLVVAVAGLEAQRRLIMYQGAGTGAAAVARWRVRTVDWHEGTRFSRRGRLHQPPGVGDICGQKDQCPMYLTHELEKHHCRWPIAGADAATAFCGADRVEGSPYCAQHSRLAYQPARGATQQSRAEAEIAFRRMAKIRKAKAAA